MRGDDGRAAVLVLAAALLGCGHADQVTPGRKTASGPTRDISGIPVAVSPSGLMRPGAERLLQVALAARGFLTERQITGTFSEATREALRRLQIATGLPATGLPSYATVEALGLEPGRIFHTGPRTSPPRAEAWRPCRTTPASPPRPSPCVCPASRSASGPAASRFMWRHRAPDPAPRMTH